MASIRKIKKDIDYITQEIVADCFYYMEFYPEAKQDTAIELVKQIIEVRNDLISRANHPDGKDNRKMVRTHFKQIETDFRAAIEKLYAELNSLLQIEA